MGILEDKSRARLFYKYLSKVYDEVNAFIWTEEMRSEAIELVGIESDDVVLDVGCGTGFATEGLLERTEHVYALDQSIHQLEKAWAKFGKRGPIQFSRGDAERLPFEDDTFDVVWSSGSIEYWPDPVETLSECRRIVKPDGTVLIVGPNYPKTTLFQKLADAMMFFYDEGEADRMFHEAGFPEFEHHLMGPPHSPEIAITTLAHATKTGAKREIETTTS